LAAAVSFILIINKRLRVPEQIPVIQCILVRALGLKPPGTKKAMVRAAKKPREEAKAKGDQVTALISTPEVLHMAATRANNSKADVLFFMVILGKEHRFQGNSFR
jgi:hypothetical protein